MTRSFGKACVATLPIVLLLGSILPAQTNTSSVTQPPRILRFEVELHQITPSEITIEEGKYILRVYKGVVVTDLDFELRRGVGSEASVQARRSANNRAMLLHLPADLQPGRYSLVVPATPKWKCEITVTARGQRGGQP